MCKGGDHKRRSEPSNHARITAAHDTEVSQGILCQEEKQATDAFTATTGDNRKYAMRLLNDAERILPNWAY